MGYYSSGYIVSGYYAGSEDVNASVGIITNVNNAVSNSTASQASITVDSIISVKNAIGTTVVTLASLETSVFGSLDIPDSMIPWTERVGRQQIAQQRVLDKLEQESKNHLTGQDIQPLFGEREIIFYV